MITYDEFEQMVKEELSLLPDYVRQDLSGGVLIDPAAYLHPARAADDLYILGTYSKGGYMGNQIILYYGSFMATLGYAPRAAVQNQVRETLRHEFLHHMETKAGEKTLVEEDRDRMIKYFLRHGQHGPGSEQS
ncbi:MAG: metallopeptidase family protein [Lachnospiraceae bacterium]|nr:metallopeptidase family protein [Lachnospiraceae bacterium]